MLSDIINNYDPYCWGILLLGLNQNTKTLKKQFQFEPAQQYPICKGFAIGRSIFQVWSRKWLQGKINNDQYIQGVEKNYTELISLWDQYKVLNNYKGYGYEKKKK